MIARYMLDIETMGLAPGSAIVSIGAVKFDETGILDTFYQRVSLQSCIDFGFAMDADAVLWWMQQDDAARKELQPGHGFILTAVLIALSRFIRGDEREVWGNGSDFDNALLQEAFRRCKLTVPWRYRDNRCYRTVKNLFPEVKAPTGGTKHNALDDATNQALHLIEILKVMRAGVPA